MNPEQAQTPLPENPASVDAGETTLVEFRYQPSYPEGHELAGQPMGGEQVIKYDGTADDLGRKMVENNNRLQAELRNVRRQVATSRPAEDEEEIPADAARASTFKAIQPRELTDAECVQIARELSDPTKVREALKTALHAQLGATPEQLARNDQIQVRNFLHAQGAEFRRIHPELDWRITEVPDPRLKRSGCPTVDTLLAWCSARDLAATVENLELALSRLKKAGLLSDAPITAEEITREIVPGGEEPPPVDSGAERSQPAKRPTVRTSALNDRTSGRAHVPATRGEPTWAEIESLSADQIRARPADWKFKALMLFRKLPADDLNRKLKSKAWENRLNALE